MEGKGWFIIYGVLVLLVIYLFIAQQSQAGKVRQLQADVAQLSSRSQAAPQESASASPEASASPDLSNAAARDKQREADLKAITAALAKFHADKHYYPNSLQQLVPSYLATLPKDPLSPKYSYRYIKTATGYKLSAYLETSDYPDDRIDGKQDHILSFTEQTGS